MSRKHLFLQKREFTEAKVATHSNSIVKLWQELKGLYGDHEKDTPGAAPSRRMPQSVACRTLPSYYKFSDSNKIPASITETAEKTSGGPVVPKSQSS